MRSPSRLLRVLFVGLTLLFGLALVPWAVRTVWEQRSSNPVRRGIERASELGCFACHGSLGQGGLPDPGIVGREVPAWDGGVWMMHVQSDEQIHRYILDGTVGEHDPAAAERIEMPAYETRLRGSDLDDLTAAFKVLSAMSVPPEDSDARRGYDLSKRWGCENCHNAGAAGGLPNPGSFAGYVPGWYGPDFEDLVRSRDEFDEWIEQGSLARLREHWLARRFLTRQTLAMPRYPQFSDRQKQALWSYARWLAETDGGHAGVEPQWTQ